MNISVKGEYALQALFDLASQSPGEPIRIADIARRQKIPQKFLELILAGLKQGGFVESRRGAEGGYLLARSADSITVGEVLRYMESSRTAKASLRHDSESPFSRVWTDIERAVSTVVDRATFGDLVREWRERQGQYVPTWDI
jgi:Rrf2 family protein